MTIEQLVELLKFINENNGWNDSMCENVCDKHRKIFKYVNTSFDTRDGHVWRVELTDSVGDADKVFRIDCEKDLKELYAYLNESYKEY